MVFRSLFSHRVQLALLLISWIPATLHAQTTDSAQRAYDSARIAYDSSMKSYDDAWSNAHDLATGHSYLGAEAGGTWTTYVGSKNFMWNYATFDPNRNNAPKFHTYLPFASLGSGIGLLGGLKIGIAAAHFLDIETKFRYVTNHSSSTYTQENLILDVFKNPPLPVANATSTYSITSDNISLSVLGHLRLSNMFYFAAGADYSTMNSATFAAHQDLAGGVGYYIWQDTHSNSFIPSIDQPKISYLNYLENARTDILAGGGATYRLGASNYILDAELLVSIPLSPWLKTGAQAMLDSEATHFQQPAITFPKMWYASLSVGLRFPFKHLPEIPIEPSEPIPPVRHDTILAVKVAVVKDTTGTPVLSGTVTSESTGAPIPAVVTTVDLNTNQVISRDSTDAQGRYHVKVAKPGKYSVTADADGYLFGTAYFEVDSAGRILASHPDIKLSPAIGRTRLLVFFDFNKSDLQPASTPQLNHVVDLMKAVPAMKVEIAGYTDSVGTRNYNLDLSKRRANAVKDYLVQHGITADRIAAKGYGTDSPIATNSTDEGRAENRRVEFVVVAR